MHNRAHMRRALLLATVLAVPTLGAAQAAGTMSFTNTDADPKASTINIAECRSGTATVQISWAPTNAAGTGTVTYQLFASNKPMTRDNFAGLDETKQCPAEGANTTNGTLVVKVGNELTNPTTLVNQPFPTARMAAALVSSTVPDPCANGGTTTIYLCMAGKVGGVEFGTARATITLALTTPDNVPSLGTPIAPGNGALTPTWSDSSTNATWHQVKAISTLDPAALTTLDFDPATAHSIDPRDTVPHTSGFVSGDSVRLTGLQNGVTYAVMVTGFTEDYNPGPPSNIGSGTPEITRSFWDTYKDAGGPETGGCSSGLAGPLALALLAGTLALARRRK